MSGPEAGILEIFQKEQSEFLKDAPGKGTEMTNGNNLPAAAISALAETNINEFSDGMQKSTDKTPCP